MAGVLSGHTVDFGNGNYATPIVGVHPTTGALESAAGAGLKRYEDCVLTAHGEFSSATLTMLVLPTVTAKFVVLKARAANAGNVYVGLTGVTKADGAVDTTTGMELAGGDMTPVIPCTNLNTFFRAADNAADSILYWCFS